MNQQEQRNKVKESLLEARSALDSLINNPSTINAIQDAAELIVSKIKSGGRLFTAGNGGSMCDAMHFAEELTGKFREDRPAIPATAISDSSHITCVANDYGFEKVFSRYLEAHARKGDVFVAISTSGSSKNILHAAEFSKRNGVSVIALTGKPLSQLGTLADIHIATPAGKWADRVQELHIKVIHILIELIEENL
jgi:D-sedoheptulose 7-phosphate isomerase